MTAQGHHAWTPGPRWPGRAEQTLDQALVAGLLVEILLDSSPSGRPAPLFQDLIKTRLKHACAFHLGGLVTLDRFRTLMGTLEDSFALYYPLLSRAVGAPAPAGAAGPGLPGITGASGQKIPALKEEPLEEWYCQHPGLLPCRPYRKLTWSRLKEFLGLTRGRWFGPKDFARHFGLDRKTALEYLHRLRQAGLLLHNQACSAAARYCLEDRFLRVRAQALRQQVRLALAAAPEAGERRPGRLSHCHGGRSLLGGPVARQPHPLLWAGVSGAPGGRRGAQGAGFLRPPPAAPASSPLAPGRRRETRGRLSGMSASLPGPLPLFSFSRETPV